MKKLANISMLLMVSLILFVLTFVFLIWKKLLFVAPFVGGWVSLMFFVWVLSSVFIVLLALVYFFQIKLAFFEFFVFKFGLFFFVFYIAFSIFFVLYTATGFTSFKTNSTANMTQQAEETPTKEQLQDCGGIFLNLELTDYPKEIKSMCQKVSFKIKVKNVGNTAFAKNVIDKGEYVFDFFTDKQGAGTTLDIMKVKEFTPILPGKSAIIEIYNKTPGNGFDFSKESLGNVQTNILLYRNKVIDEKTGTKPVCSNMISAPMFLNEYVGSKEDERSCFSNGN